MQYSYSIHQQISDNVLPLCYDRADFQVNQQVRAPIACLVWVKVDHQAGPYVGLHFKDQVFHYVQQFCNS